MTNTQTTTLHYSHKGHTTVNDPSYISSVSGMALRYRPRVPKGKRLEVIRAEYGSCTLAELAQHAHVSLATIKKDVAEWKRSGGYEEWEEREWHRLYHSPTVPDWKKFDALTNFRIKRMLSALDHATPEVKQRFAANVLLDPRYRDVILSLSREVGGTNIAKVFSSASKE